jgi:hypothetical protein
VPAAADASPGPLGPGEPDGVRPRRARLHDPRRRGVVELIGYCTLDCGRGAASPLPADALPLPNATTANANPAKIVISRLAPAGHRECPRTGVPSERT